MRTYYRTSIILFIILLTYNSYLKGNDQAIELGLTKVNFSSNLDGWTTVTESEQIRYGEWRNNNPINQVGWGGGWGNWGPTVVWENYKTVTSNEFERTSFNGEYGLVIQSIDPFVPSNATQYTPKQLGSYIVSPRIDLSRSGNDHLFFQYKRDRELKLEVWLSKNNESYLGIWEENPSRYINHINVSSLGNGFSQVRIDLQNLLIEMGQILISNDLEDSVISPENDELYIVFVAYDNANRRIGSVPNTIDIKSIWTPSYYGVDHNNEANIEPEIRLEPRTERVTVLGKIGETYELQKSLDLERWEVSHSFTLKTRSETYPLSYFQEDSKRTQFFRLEHKP